RGLGASDPFCRWMWRFHGVGIRSSKSMVNARSACFYPELRIPVLGLRSSSTFRTARWRTLRAASSEGSWPRLRGNLPEPGVDRQPGVDRLDGVGNRYEDVGLAGSTTGRLPVGGWLAYGATVRDRGAGSEAG